MQRDADLGSSEQSPMLQKTFNRCATSTRTGKSRRQAIAVLLTGAAMVAVASLGNGLNAPPAGKETGSSRVTVIYKNQMHPSIGELEARAAEKYDSGQANGDREIVFQRRGQWI
jgi:hypothetical protein